MRRSTNGIDMFEMQRNEHGKWLFDRAQSELWERHAALIKEHQSLIRRWNKFVGEYNARIAPRERGRPLGANTAQQADVLKRRKAGASLRTIAKATVPVASDSADDHREGAGQGSHRKAHQCPAEDGTRPAARRPLSGQESRSGSAAAGGQRAPGDRCGTGEGGEGIGALITAGRPATRRTRTGSGAAAPAFPPVRPCARADRSQRGMRRDTCRHLAGAVPGHLPAS
jgi:hypothetical protein